MKEIGFLFFAGGGGKGRLGRVGQGSGPTTTAGAEPPRGSTPGEGVLASDTFGVS